MINPTTSIDSILLGAIIALQILIYLKVRKNKFKTQKHNIHIDAKSKELLINKPSDIKIGSNGSFKQSGK